MKTLAYSLTALLLAVLSLVVVAEPVERKDFIAEQAADVRPLLIGEKIPDVTLFDAEGSPVNILEMAAKKPTVLLFYRGGWCPFCNAQLSQLQKIEQDLLELGYQLVL